MDFLIHPFILGRRRRQHHPPHQINLSDPHTATYTTREDEDALLRALSMYACCDKSNVIPAYNIEHLILMTYAGSDKRLGLCVSTNNEFAHTCSAFCQVLDMEEPSADINLYYISNPNRVYGTTLLEQKIVNWAIKYPDVLFIVDESYIEYTSNSLCTAALKCSNVIIVRTLIRSFGVAMDYAVSNPDIIDKLQILANQISRSLVTEALTALKTPTNEVTSIADEVSALKNTISQFLFADAIIYECIGCCAWIILKCKRPVCSTFLSHGILVCDLSEVLPGCVRIAYVRGVCDKIVSVIKQINFGYDAVVFGLESLRCATFPTKKKLGMLSKKYIISNDATPTEKLIDELKLDCAVISPITLAMNPREREWFVYDDAVYLVQYPNINDYHLLSTIAKYKVVRVIEKTYSISSSVMGKIPDIQMPFIGVAMEFIQRTMPDVKWQIIGKEVLKYPIEATRVLVVGNVLDKVFATHNNYDYYEATTSDMLQNVLSLLTS